MRFRIGPWNVNIQNRNYAEEVGILKKQKQLFFRCPICGEPVTMNRLPDGRTILQWMVDEKFESIEGLTISHSNCGMEMTIAVAEEMAVQYFGEGVKN